jgi:hypothetical protein
MPFLQTPYLSVKKETRRAIDGSRLEEAGKGGEDKLATVLSRLIVQKATSFLLDVNAKNYQ